MATALYRRYRPETFAEVIGQEHVTEPLMRALRNNRIGHAYLFSGPRGCGKTTSARILARCLNCAEGPTDTPCGACDSCRELATGGPGSLDVVEIDAASHGGVDDARELRERATFAPARDRFKVFIIDEAHMVTSAGFNALLKLVEEPPEHVKFVFATTEPDKVIGTIRSRTHHYPFRLVPPHTLIPYLEELCAKEDVHVGQGVLPLVVRAGGGSVRDTLSVLDQLMAGAGDDGVDYPMATALLGFTDAALLDSVVDAFAARDAATVFSAIDRVIGSGQEPRRFVEDLLERLRDLIVVAAVPDRSADLLPEVPSDQLERMDRQSSLFGARELSHAADVVNDALATMTGATSPRIHLELLCARILLGPQQPVAAQAPGVAADQRPRGGETRPGPGGGDVRDEARRVARQKAQAARAAREGTSAAPSSAAQTAPGEQPAPAGQPGPAGQFAPSAADPTSIGAVPEQAVPDDARAQPAASDRPAESDRRASASRPDGATAPEEAPGADSPGPDASDAAMTPAEVGAAPRIGAAESTASGDDSPTSVGDLRTSWPEVMEALSHIRRPTWALVAQNANVATFDGSTVALAFSTPGLLGAFRRPGMAENVAQAVQQVLGLSVEVVGIDASELGTDPAPPAHPAGPSASAPSPRSPSSGPSAATTHSASSSGPASPPSRRDHDGAGIAQDAARAASSVPAARPRQDDDGWGPVAHIPDDDPDPEPAPAPTSSIPSPTEWAETEGRAAEDRDAGDRVAGDRAAGDRAGGDHAAGVSPRSAADDAARQPVAERVEERIEDQPARCSDHGAPGDRGAADDESGGHDRARVDRAQRTSPDDVDAPAPGDAGTDEEGGAVITGDRPAQPATATEGVADPREASVVPDTRTSRSRPSPQTSASPQTSPSSPAGPRDAGAGLNATAPTTHGADTVRAALRANRARHPDLSGPARFDRDGAGHSAAGHPAAGHTAAGHPAAGRAAAGFPAGGHALGGRTVADASQDPDDNPDAAVSRDDVDAGPQIAAGQQVVEQYLGGRVIEIVDGD